MTRYSIIVTLASLAIGATLLVACGGGGTKEPVATQSPAATEPASQPTSAPQPTIAPAFQSFHYTVDFKATLDSPTAGPVTSLQRRVDGDFAAPASHAFIGDSGPQSQTNQGVVIGNDAWYREGNGAWQKLSLADFFSNGAIALTSALPGFLNDGSFADGLQGLDSTPDNIAVETALKYVVPPDQVDRIASLFRAAFIQDVSQMENLNLTVWVDSVTGALVRAELAATTTPAAILGAGGTSEIPPDTIVTVTLAIKLSQVNDTSIKISPPI